MTVRHVNRWHPCVMQPTWGGDSGKTGCHSHFSHLRSFLGSLKSQVGHTSIIHIHFTSSSKWENINSYNLDCSGIYTVLKCITPSGQSEEPYKEFTASYENSHVFCLSLLNWVIYMYSSAFICRVNIVNLIAKR